jgi:enamine deaminase RidA (YjgF/YER057c/UK114 family)
VDGRYRSGGPWEERVGYSRAVRVRDFIAVAGTTAAEPDGTFAAPGDAGAQARRIFEIIEGALTALGASLDDVIRVRIFVRDIADLPAVTAVYTERLGRVAPAATGIEVSRLIVEEALVEIEADAIVRG